jgi:hypothetical protein
MHFHVRKLREKFVFRALVKYKQHKIYTINPLWHTSLLHDAFVLAQYHDRPPQDIKQWPPDPPLMSALRLEVSYMSGRQEN